MGYLKEIEISAIWGTKSLEWENIYPDVNILVGVNGSGKTTLLNLVWGTLNNNEQWLKKYNYSQVKLTDMEGRILAIPPIADGDDMSFSLDSEFISTFDVIPSHFQTNNSPLTYELLDTIYTTGRRKRSFFDYRLKASNFPDQAKEVNDNIQYLYKLINKQFSATKKQIKVDVETNKLIFEQGSDIIQLEDLSSGEKQFLLIIFKVFLMEKKPYLLLMDEPEISLDVDWQFELINVIRELNPLCQIIISTHSPSIFGDGWGDRVVYMEDILTL